VVGGCGRGPPLFDGQKNPGAFLTGGGGGGGHITHVNSGKLLLCRPVFLNGRAAARYRALASIIPGREDSPGIDN